MPETRTPGVGLRGIPGVMGGIESHCEQIFPRLKVFGGEDDIAIIGRRPCVEGCVSEATRRVYGALASA